MKSPPDARRLLLQAMSNEALLKAITALRLSAPDYLSAMLKSGHDEGLPEKDLRSLFELGTDDILEMAEPTWSFLKEEAARRALSIPSVAPPPYDPPINEIEGLLEEVSGIVPEIFPVPFHEIQATRAFRASLGHPLLPLSWVDFMRRFPGLRLGGLRIFPPGDPAFSDPEIQVHRDLVVFGKSGKNLLHAYGKSGRCYVISRDAAQKGKTKQARLTAAHFVEYIKCVLPAAISAHLRRGSDTQHIASANVSPKLLVGQHKTSDPVEAPDSEKRPNNGAPEEKKYDAEAIDTQHHVDPASFEKPSYSVVCEDSNGAEEQFPNNVDLASSGASEWQASYVRRASASAEERKKRSEAMLVRWRLTAPPLPAGISDEDAILRPAGAVAWRALCLMTVLAWSSGFSLADEARAVGVPENRVQHVFGHEVARRLTMRERMFLAMDPPQEQERNAMLIKAEALAVLLRALGILKRLPMPNEAADSALIFSLGFQALVREEKRPPLAITEAMALDLRDFYQRLHWIQRMSELRGQKAPAGLRGDILRERRHAIEWLVSSHEIGFLEWDQIDINLPLPIAP